MIRVIATPLNLDKHLSIARVQATQSRRCSTALEARSLNGEKAYESAAAGVGIEPLITKTASATFSASQPPEMGRAEQQIRRSSSVSSCSCSMSAGTSSADKSNVHYQAGSSAEENGRNGTSSRRSFEEQSLVEEMVQQTHIIDDETGHLYNDNSRLALDMQATEEGMGLESLEHCGEIMGEYVLYRFA